MYKISEPPCSPEGVDVSPLEKRSSSIHSFNATVPDGTNRESNSNSGGISSSSVMPITGKVTYSHRLIQASLSSLELGSVRKGKGFLKKKEKELSFSPTAVPASPSTSTSSPMMASASCTSTSGSHHNPQEQEEHIIHNSNNTSRIPISDDGSFSPPDIPIDLDTLFNEENEMMRSRPGYRAFSHDDRPPLPFPSSPSHYYSYDPRKDQDNTLSVRNSTSSGSTSESSGVPPPAPSSSLSSPQTPQEEYQAQLSSSSCYSPRLSAPPLPPPLPPPPHANSSEFPSSSREDKGNVEKIHTSASSHDAFHGYRPPPPLPPPSLLPLPSSFSLTRTVMKTTQSSEGGNSSVPAEVSSTCASTAPNYPSLHPLPALPPPPASPSSSSALLSVSPTRTTVMSPRQANTTTTTTAANTPRSISSPSRPSWGRDKSSKEKINGKKRDDMRKEEKEDENSKKRQEGGKGKGWCTVTYASTGQVVKGPPPPALLLAAAPAGGGAAAAAAAHSCSSSSSSSLSSSSFLFCDVRKVPPRKPPTSTSIIPTTTTSTTATTTTSSSSSSPYHFLDTEFATLLAENEGGDENDGDGACVLPEGKLYACLEYLTRPHTSWGSAQRLHATKPKKWRSTSSALSTQSSSRSTTLRSFSTTSSNSSSTGVTTTSVSLQRCVDAHDERAVLARAWGSVDCARRRRHLELERRFRSASCSTAGSGTCGSGSSSTGGRMNEDFSGVLTATGLLPSNRNRNSTNTHSSCNTSGGTTMMNSHSSCRALRYPHMGPNENDDENNGDWSRVGSASVASAPAGFPIRWWSEGGVKSTSVSSSLLGETTRTTSSSSSLLLGSSASATTDSSPSHRVPRRGCLRRQGKIAPLHVNESSFAVPNHHSSFSSHHKISDEDDHDVYGSDGSGGRKKGKKKNKEESKREEVVQDSLAGHRSGRMRWSSPSSGSKHNTSPAPSSSLFVAVGNRMSVPSSPMRMEVQQCRSSGGGDSSSGLPLSCVDRKEARGTAPSSHLLNSTLPPPSCTTTHTRTSTTTLRRGSSTINTDVSPPSSYIPLCVGLVDETSVRNIHGEAQGGARQEEYDNEGGGEGRSGSGEEEKDKWSEFLGARDEKKRREEETKKGSSRFDVFPTGRVLPPSLPSFPEQEEQKKGKKKKIVLGTSAVGQREGDTEIVEGGGIRRTLKNHPSQRNKSGMKKNNEKRPTTKEGGGGGTGLESKWEDLCVVSGISYGKGGKGDGE